MKMTMINAGLPVPPVLGGPIATTVFETTLGLKEPEPTAISCWRDELNKLRIDSKGPFYHVDIEKQGKEIKQIFKDQIPRAFQDPITFRRFSFLNGITDLLHEINPDIIQVHNGPYFMSYLAREFPNKKLILSLHNHFDYTQIHLDNVIKSIDHFIFVSHYLKDKFIKYHPHSKPKTKVIYNGINTEVWHPNQEKTAQTKDIKQQHQLPPGKTLLFIGRTVRDKGIHCLLNALPFVLNRFPETVLLIVGSPAFKVTESNPFLKRLQKQAKILSKNIVFTGYIDNAQTPYFYAAADITIVPSLFQDPCPKVVIESLATGTPIIGSRRGGIPELIENGVDGLLLDNPEDAVGLADHIIALLENQERREAMGRAARLKGERQFTLSGRLERLQNFYRSDI